MTGPDTAAMPPTAASPLRVRPAGVRVERRADGSFTASGGCRIEPDEPVLAGHYPGFPIVPGVCVIESAHQVFLAAVPGQRLAEVISCRFTGPAFPGDELRAELDCTPEESGWRAAIKVRSARGPLASLRLRYRPEEGERG